MPAQQRRAAAAQQRVPTPSCSDTVPRQRAVSNNGARVRFVLYKKGLEGAVDIRPPKDLGGLQSPEYRALNPQVGAGRRGRCQGQAPLPGCPHAGGVGAERWGAPGCGRCRGGGKLPRLRASAAQQSAAPGLSPWLCCCRPGAGQDAAAGAARWHGAAGEPGGSIAYSSALGGSRLPAS